MLLGRSFQAALLNVLYLAAVWLQSNLKLCKKSSVTTCSFVTETVDLDIVVVVYNRAFHYKLIRERNHWVQRSS